jgi:pre-rRNA-processing protein TSR1
LFAIQDVRYFKPAELITKHGLRGHIKESVGIHGLFKAFFSGPIKQNDKVLLILYKRVYPKFPEEGIEIL